jgi:hypothetical protein
VEIILDYKRLQEIQALPTPTTKDVVEITSENFLSASKHSKDIKAMLVEILEGVNDLSSRIAVLEARQSSIFQIEEGEDVDEEFDDEMSLEEEIALSED